MLLGWVFSRSVACLALCAYMYCNVCCSSVNDRHSLAFSCNDSIDCLFVFVVSDLHCVVFLSHVRWLVPASSRISGTSAPVLLTLIVLAGRCIARQRNQFYAELGVCSLLAFQGMDV